MTIAAVVLAAGKSERFGSPKALARWGQRFFAEQIVETAREAGLTPRAVVLGHAADRIAGVLPELSAELVTNPDYESGQFSSVQAGLAAVRGRCAGAVICLVDQPQVRPAELAAVGQVLQQGRASLVVPTVEGRGVHPVGIGAAWFEEILNMPRTATLRDFFRKHREAVFRLELQNSLLLRDVDTQQDLLELEQLAGSAAEKVET